MTVTVNGNAVDLELDSTSLLGEVLAYADDLVEKAGSVILGLSLDGKPVDPDSLPALRDRPADSYERLDIDCVPAFELRSRAYGALLEFLASLKGWVQGSDSSGAIRGPWDSYSLTYSGILSSDEHSFLDLMGRDIASLASDPLPPDRQKLLRHADRLEPIFRERLDELIDPAAAMRSTSLLYASERENIKEVPVHLQTGKDAEAMRSILLFVEIFNKVNRILPELSRSGTNTESLRIDGLSLPEYYKSFNTILRQLMEAFEKKDAVLIGDLAEYEIVPRMNAFFDAVIGALDS